MPNQRECNAIKSASRTRANTTPTTTTSTTSTSSNTKSNQSSNQSHQRYAIRLAFDGTTYNGFQSQPNSNTIQDQIEHRLSGVLNRNIRVVAWGRTDAGVHARGAVVTVDLNLDEVRMLAKRVTKKKKKKNSKNSLPSSVEVEEEEGGDARAKQIITDAARFLRSVRYVCNSGIDATTTTTSNTNYKNNSNSREGSITSISVTPVPIHFDARYSAVWKRYVYYICDNCDTQTNLPFAWDRYSWQIKQSLDLDRMVDAAALLSCGGGGCYRALGEEECGNDERKQKQQQQQHNFEWLCVMQPGELRDPRRTVRLSVEVLSRSTVENEEEEDNVPYFLQKNGRSVVYKITGVCDFFLYKMMRRIVGTIVAIGKHDADLDDLKKCIDAYDNYDDDDDDDDLRKGTTKIPAKLLQTAPAKGLCLDHIEYGIAI